MKRVDYLPPPRRIRLRLPMPDARLRRPLAALGAAIACCALSALFESLRVSDTQHRGARLTDELNAADSRAALVFSLERDIVRLRTRALHAESARRSGPAGADAIAALGNRLPPTVWLTSLRVTPLGIALEGRGERLEAIAAALTALSRLPGVTRVRLTSARLDTVHGGFSYAVALEQG